MSCTKVRYSNHALALAALAKVKEKSTRHEQRAYLCPWCHCWHLTSQPIREAS